MSEILLEMWSTENFEKKKFCQINLQCNFFNEKLFSREKK